MGESDCHIALIPSAKLSAQLFSFFPFWVHQVSLFDYKVFANSCFFSHSCLYLPLFFLLLLSLSLQLQLLLVFLLLVFVQLIVFYLPQEKHKLSQWLFEILWIVVMNSVLYFERTTHSKAFANLQLDAHSYSIFISFNEATCLQTAYEMTCKSLERRGQLQICFEIYKEIDV